MKKLVVYIAGPISAPSAWDREDNIRRAEALALEVLDAGMAAICVHSGARVMYGARPEELFLAADFSIIEICNAMLLVNGWERSSGTRREIDHAHEVAVPVFGALGDLIAWRDALGREEARLGPAVTCTFSPIGMAIRYGAFTPRRVHHEDPGKIGPECFGGSDFDEA